LKLHELIDKDVPCCLYCNVEFDTNAISIKSSSGSSLSHLKTGKHLMTRYDTETLYCVDCMETFEIHSHQSDEGETTYTGFTFSCKNYSVFNNYIEDYFDISDRKGKHLFAIPSFTVNFSDKNKLYEKLKTYTIFS
jgi:hypothetical protein